MMTTSTGPFADSILSPSCSRTAVNRDGPDRSSAAAGVPGLPFVSGGAGSAAHFRCTSYDPAKPVLSITLLPVCNRDRLSARAPMLIPWPSNVQVNPLRPDRGNPQKGRRGVPGVEGSGGASGEKGVQLPSFVGCNL